MGGEIGVGDGVGIGVGDGRVQSIWTIVLSFAGSTLKFVTGVKSPFEDAIDLKSEELTPFPTPMVEMNVPAALIPGETSTPRRRPLVSAPSVMRMIMRGLEAFLISASQARRPSPDEVTPVRCGLFRRAFLKAAMFVVRLLTIDAVSANPTAAKEEPGASLTNVSVMEMRASVCCKNCCGEIDPDSSMT